MSRLRTAVCLSFVAACADDDGAARCELPAADYVVEATIVGTPLCAPGTNQSTSFVSFVSGTRDYPAERCSTERSLSEDGCSITLDERCEAALDASRTGRLWRMTTYSLKDPRHISGTRTTYGDFCSLVETLSGHPLP